LIEIGSGNFIDPNIVCKIKADLENYLFSKGFSSISEVIGRLLQLQ